MNIITLGAGVAASHFLPDNTDANKYPPGFLIEWSDGERLMFECAEGVRFRLEEMKIDYASIEHIAVSHPHPDHYAPLHYLQAVFCKGLWGGEEFKREHLSLYGPTQLIDDFPALWKIHLPEMDGYYDWPQLQLTDMMKKSMVSVGSATLRAFPVYHAFGKCDALAYRLETPEGVVVYSGDTGDCQGIRDAAKDADVFICEASARVGNTENKHGYGHLDPTTVGEIARDADVKTLIVFQYTRLDSDDDIISSVEETGFSGKIILAKDLVTYTC